MALMPNIGPLEIIVVLIIALVVFGPKRLPELGRSMGKGINEFKDSVSGGGSDDDDDGEQLPELERPKEEPKATPKAEPVEAVEGEVVTEKQS
jgi:sec-independent protein translocase protein TatA